MDDGGSGEAKCPESSNVNEVYRGGQEKHDDDADAAEPFLRPLLPLKEIEGTHIIAHNARHMYEIALVGVGRGMAPVGARGF